VDVLVDGVVQAARLLAGADPELLQIVWLSLQVSGAATALSVLVGAPLGAVMALTPFPGRRLLASVVNTGMGMPPVVVGLFVSLMLWRSGPFGFLGMLYTPWAMVVAQAMIATPLAMGLSFAGVAQIDPKLILQMRGLGASRLQLLWIVLHEARRYLLAAVIAAFGAVISEVGASMMVGGNIKGQTRVLTTAIVMETARGNFGLAVALGLILLLLTYLVVLGMTVLQQRDATR